MKTFRIKETNELKRLSLVDPKTGCCWLADAMSSDNNVVYDLDADGYECSQDTFDWWEAFVADYQAADDSWYDLLDNADNDKREQMLGAYEDLDADLADYPEALIELCVQFTAPKTKKAVYIKAAECKGSGSDRYKTVTGITQNVLAEIARLNDRFGCELTILVDSNTKYLGQKFKKVEIRGPYKNHRQINDADYEIVAVV
jgi:hypothetical protein